jgi:hypothetical protein
MLGKKIGQGTGKVVGLRVLKGETAGFKKMEISFSAEETWYGQQVSVNVTALTVEKAPGVVYSEFDGIAMTADGAGAVFDGIGALTMGEGGTMKIRGASSMATRSESLSKLNGVLVVSEIDVAADQTCKITHWEWL